MRLVTAQEMGAMDQKASSEYGIPGVVLMENAGFRVADLVTSLLDQKNHCTIIILAGKGNNGGDGFVAARHLFNRGIQVQVFLAADPDKIKGDALINLNIWRKMGQKTYPLLKNNDLNLFRLAIMKVDLVVDALYGTGFAGELPEHMTSVIEIVNASNKPVVAIDIPSGLEADTGRAQGQGVKAKHTVTFALPKLGLVLPEAKEYVGKLHVEDISIPAAITDIEKESTAKVSRKGSPANGLICRCLVTKELVEEWWPKRFGAEHKGDFGRVLVIAGSRGMSGAAVLAAQAAARAGAGLVSLGVPEGIHDITEAKLTEVMTFPLPQTARGILSRTALDEILKRADKCDVLAIGPGLGQDEEIEALVKEMMPQLKTPCILDADGLNALGSQAEILSTALTDLVITPHPGEMSRLTGLSIEQIQKNRLEVATTKAVQWNSIVVLKGAGTVVAGPDNKLFINNTGNSGMATGGSGDVLTGLIAGLVSQGMPPLLAAAAGVYLHGLAGDFAARKKGLAGLIAGDILEQLPKALQTVETVI